MHSQQSAFSCPTTTAERLYGSVRVPATLDTYVAWIEKYLRMARKPNRRVSKEGEKEKPKQKLSKLEQLQHQLAEAVVKEEYEKAAKLRDEIQKLQARNS